MLLKLHSMAKSRMNFLLQVGVDHATPVSAEVCFSLVSCFKVLDCLFATDSDCSSQSLQNESEINIALISNSDSIVRILDIFKNCNY